MKFTYFLYSLGEQGEQLERKPIPLRLIAMAKEGCLYDR